MTRPAKAERLRRLALTGAINFRDFGGYQTRDGRSLKWGQLFRSDSLAELSEDDLLALAALNLRSICDLRHEDERTERPNRLGAGSTRIRTHAIGFYPHGAEVLMNRVRQRLITVDEAAQGLRDMYSRLPVDQAGNYAQLLQILIEPDALPALIHCTSGKDRTGFAAAVVLLALGVPRETIVEDYVLTNQYRRDLSFMLGSDVDPLVLDMVKRADPEFLLAAFEAIDTTWGGDEAFIRNGLDFSDASRMKLQERLLE